MSRASSSTRKIENWHNLTLYCSDQEPPRGRSVPAVVIRAPVLPPPVVWNWQGAGDLWKMEDSKMEDQIDVSVNEAPHLEESSKVISDSLVT
jgi:hypothetical protein